MPAPLDSSQPRLAAGCRWGKQGEDPVVLFPEGIIRLQGTGQSVLELCDGERTLLQIVEIQRDQAGTQRQQAAVLLEIAQRHAALDQRLAELTERVHTVISAIDRFLDRWRNGRG